MGAHVSKQSVIARFGGFASGVYVLNTFLSNKLSLVTKMGCKLHVHGRRAHHIRVQTLKFQKLMLKAAAPFTEKLKARCGRSGSSISVASCSSRPGGGG